MNRQRVLSAIVVAAIQALAISGCAAWPTNDRPATVASAMAGLSVTVTPDSLQPGSRKVQWNLGASALQQDVDEVIVAIACLGNSQGRVLGRQMLEDGQGNLAEGPVEESWAQQALDGPAGIARLVGTRQASESISVALPGDLNRRSRWLVRRIPGTRFGNGREIAFRNLPLPDGQGAHAYVLVAAAMGQGRVMGFRERAIADSAFVPGQTLSLPSLTLSLDEGHALTGTVRVLTPGLPAAAIQDLPYCQTVAGSSSAWTVGATFSHDIPLAEVTALRFLADDRLAVGTAAPGDLWIFGEGSPVRSNQNAEDLLGTPGSFVRAIAPWSNDLGLMLLSYANAAYPPVPYRIADASPSIAYYAESLSLPASFRAVVPLPEGGKAWIHDTFVDFEGLASGSFRAGVAGDARVIDDALLATGSARFRDLRAGSALSGGRLVVAEADRLRVIRYLEDPQVPLGNVSLLADGATAGSAHAPRNIRGVAALTGGRLILSDPDRGILLQADPDSGKMRLWAGQARHPADMAPGPVDGYAPHARLVRPGPLLAQTDGSVIVGDGPFLRVLR